MTKFVKIILFSIRRTSIYTDLFESKYENMFNNMIKLERVENKVLVMQGCENQKC